MEGKTLTKTNKQASRDPGRQTNLINKQTSKNFMLLPTNSRWYIELEEREQSEGAGGGQSHKTRVCSQDPSPQEKPCQSKKI